MHISAVSPSACPWGLAMLWPCHPAIWPCEYLFHFVHIMASTCRNCKKSMIMPVPVDVFMEFIHIHSCSCCTRHPFKMNREILFICEFRKEYEYHVWEEMCISQCHRWSFGMDHHCEQFWVPQHSIHTHGGYSILSKSVIGPDFFKNTIW